MNMYFFRALVFVIILHFAASQLTLIITQLINNVEVPLNSSQVNAYLRENLTFHCYINVTLGNNTHIDKNVVWESLQFRKPDNRPDDNSVLKFTDVQILDRRVYKCISYKYLLFKTFQLDVLLPKSLRNMFNFSTPRKFDPLIADNAPQTIHNSDEFLREMPSLANYKVRDVTYNRISKNRTGKLIILGNKHNLVITQSINNVEVPINSTWIKASLGEELTFHCYLKNELGNNTHVHKNILWSSSATYYNLYKKMDDKPVLKINPVHILHGGVYRCTCCKHLWTKSFHLEVLQPQYLFKNPNPPKLGEFILDNRQKIVSNPKVLLKYNYNFVNAKKLREANSNNLPQSKNSYKRIFAIGVL